MTVNRDQLFAELDKLSADEIEAGLDAGVWSEGRRQLVEHYLDQMKLTTLQMDIADNAKVAAQAAGGEAGRGTSLAKEGLDLAARGGGGVAGARACSV